MDEIAKGFVTLYVYIAQEDNIFSLIPAVVVFRRLARSAFQFVYFFDCRKSWVM